MRNKKTVKKESGLVRILSGFSIYLVLGSSVLVMIFTLLNVSPQTPLSGVSLSAENPERNFGAILSGKYQDSFAAYYSEKFPFRSYLIKIYNQALYMARACVRDCVIGADGWLYQTEYINNYYNINRDAQKDLMEPYAENLRIIQDKLEQQGKTFLYVITPNKAEIYPEYIPWRYSTNKTDQPNNHALLVEALERHGVNYFDTAPVMTRLKAESDQDPILAPYNRTGIHWNFVGASECVKELLSDLNLRSGLGLPELVTSYTFREEPLSTEADIFDNMNTIAGYPPDRFPEPHNSYMGGNVSENFKIFAIGTSFMQELSRVFFNSQNTFVEGVTVFNYLMYEYGFDRNSPDARSPQALNGNAYRNNITSRLDESDLLIVESNSSYVHHSHFQFVEYVKNNLTLGGFARENIDIEIAPERQSVTANTQTDILVRARITNRSSIALLSDLDRPIYFSYHIRDAEGTMVVTDGIRTRIDPPIEPGESRDVDYQVDISLPPGRYTIELSALQESVSWLENIDPQAIAFVELIIQE